jgi:uncharacterized Zn finger protein
MAARAVFLVRFLSGEMFREIEEAFSAGGATLFLHRAGDLRTRCSCPDTANPCKHIAAVFYLLAESFDLDPFRMIEWRGRDRDRLVGELRELRPPATTSSAASGGAEPGREATADDDGDRHEEERFWNGRPGWAEVRVDLHPAAAFDALLRDPPAEVFAVLDPDTPLDLRAVYAAAARAARLILDPAAGLDASEPGRGRRRGNRPARRRGGA